MPNPLYFAIADKVLGIIEKFLDPSQYDIVRMKRLKKAANWAEKDFQNTYDFFNWVELEIEMTPDKLKDFNKFKKRHDKCVEKHAKYD